MVRGREATICRRCSTWVQQPKHDIGIAADEPPANGVGDHTCRIHNRADRSSVAVLQRWSEWRFRFFRFIRYTFVSTPKWTRRLCRPILLKEGNGLMRTAGQAEGNQGASWPILDYIRRAERLIIIIIIIRNLYSAIMPLGGYRGAGGTGR